jgi:DNA repair and recombination protein RAD54B
MGSTPWKGDSLHGGYRLYIGGKEVELDCQVTRDDLPSTLGGHPDDKIPVPSAQTLGNAAETADSIGSPTTGSKTFVAPTSFYGPQAPSKAKPKGPL